MKQLVSNLIKGGVLKTKIIVDAFLKVDRKDFVLSEYEKDAYDDHPLPIGYGQTISQPTTVAFMLELLQPKSGERILDVGSGSGWTIALLADIVGPQGKVFGVEIIPELVSFGQKNLTKYACPQAAISQAGKALGLAQEAPFDRILVSAASEEIPDDLMSQLKINGIMVIPINHSICKIRKKSETESDMQEFSGFSFVPLVKQ